MAGPKAAVCPVRIGYPADRDRASARQIHKRRVGIRLQQRAGYVTTQAALGKTSFPVVEATIGGEDHGFSLVNAIDDFVQEVCELTEG
jgi:hypothetical protein